MRHRTEPTTRMAGNTVFCSAGPLKRQMDGGLSAAPSQQHRELKSETAAMPPRCVALSPANPRLQGRKVSAAQPAEAWTRSCSLPFTALPSDGRTHSSVAPPKKDRRPTEATIGGLLSSLGAIVPGSEPVSVLRGRNLRYAGQFREFSIDVRAVRVIIDSRNGLPVLGAKERRAFSCTCAGEPSGATHLSCLSTQEDRPPRGDPTRGDREGAWRGVSAHDQDRAWSRGAAFVLVRRKEGGSPCSFRGRGAPEPRGRAHREQGRRRDARARSDQGDRKGCSDAPT